MHSSIRKQEAELYKWFGAIESVNSPSNGAALNRIVCVKESLMEAWLYSTIIVLCLQIGKLTIQCTTIET